MQAIHELNFNLWIQFSVLSHLHERFFSFFLLFAVYVGEINQLVLKLLQTVVWCAIKGNSCVLEDAASSTSTAVMGTMTVGISVMREGSC